MILGGKFILKAPIQETWNNLLDPETLSFCIPGCEKMEAVDEKTYDCVEVSYRSNVMIAGRLATFGDRIMRAKSKDVERQFTQALREKLKRESPDKNV